MRPFLPPLLAGALARGDIGIDFDGTDFVFLESSAFLAAVLALAVVGYAFERSGLNRQEAPDVTPQRPPGRNPVDAGFGLVAIALGALLFAGALAEGDRQGWPGIFAGMASALLAYAAATTFLTRVRRRLEPSTRAFLNVYADAAALALAALAIFVPPVSFVALALLAWLLLAGRGGRDRKHEGLRILR